MLASGDILLYEERGWSGQVRKEESWSDAKDEGERVSSSYWATDPNFSTYVPLVAHVLSHHHHP
jgi:hypothetical protein